MAINVGMAEWKAAQSPESLKTSGLGSCVAVIIYDPYKKMAAMAHVMLPDSKMSTIPVRQMGKYADTAIPHMIDNLLRRGALSARLLAKLAGGSQMFNFKSHSTALSIGARNVEACVGMLKQHRIPIVQQDTGGANGRTVEFFCEDSRMTVKTVTKGLKVL